MTLASKILLASVPLLINLYATRYREKDKMTSFPDNPIHLGLPVKEVFDFIIVGGGTAGCVLARRLVDAKFSVLLIEAGGNPPPLQEVPLLSVYTKFLPEINFLYQSTPQKNAALANNGILQTPAGKMLGGSSSHNDMMYERGNPMDFDHWADLSGDDSWRYKNVLKFFLKAENYMGKFNYFNSDTGRQEHAHGGPMTVSRPRYAPGKEIWLQAGQELGYQIRDSNGPQGVGFSPNEFTKKFGRRVNTYGAYLRDIENDKKKRKLLTIRRYAVATQILFENKTTATHILYSHHDVLRAAFAEKEIILSAGAYMSPILLIKSGIGPMDQLKDAKVDPISVLPVGENLMDHPFLDVSPIYVNDPTVAWNMEANLTFDDFTTFLKKGEGPLTSSYTVGIAETFLASSRATNIEKSPSWPDLQIYYEYLGQEKNNVACYIGFNRPFSRGRLKVNHSASGMEDNFLPILDFNYYSNETDFDVTIEGINFCLKTIETTSAFKKIGAQFTTKPIPQCKSEKFRSKQYWKCYIRQTIDSTYHASGTCRMGHEKDKRSVVDSKFRVLGVRKLRVVDASIMPQITNANIAAPTVMIAEKAAHDIVRGHRRRG